MDGKQLQQQYKNHISDYKDWDQQTHASEWMLFEQNLGTHLSIDETALSNDELYTIVTNKGIRLKSWHSRIKLTSILYYPMNRLRWKIINHAIDNPSKNYNEVISDLLK